MKDFTIKQISIITMLPPEHWEPLRLYVLKRYSEAHIYIGSPWNTPPAVAVNGTNTDGIAVATVEIESAIRDGLYLEEPHGLAAAREAVENIEYGSSPCQRAKG